RRLRFAVPQNLMLADMDDTVARDFERTMTRIADAGAKVDKLDVPEFDEIPRINAKAGFSAPEALAWHKELIAACGHHYDPRVISRIKRGSEQTAVDYIELIAARARLIAAVEARTASYDALALPTVPFIAPRIDDLANDKDFARVNVLALRN